MSGPCTDCGGPDYQTLVARVADLEVELKAWRQMIAQMDRLRLEQVARAKQAEAERDSWKILANLRNEACNESEAMLWLACSTYVYDAGSKGFILVNDPDVQIRELRGRVRAESATP